MTKKIKVVVQMDLQGQYINCFKDIKMAGLLTGNPSLRDNYGHLYHPCNKIWHIGGFLWAKVEVTPLQVQFEEDGSGKLHPVGRNKAYRHAERLILYHTLRSVDCFEIGKLKVKQYLEALNKIANEEWTSVVRLPQTK